MRSDDGYGDDSGRRGGELPARSRRRVRRPFFDEEGTERIERAMHGGIGSIALVVAAAGLVLFAVFSLAYNAFP